MLARLHTDLRLMHACLYDRVLDVRYVITEDTARVLRFLKEDPNVDNITSQVAVYYALSEAEARQAVYALLGQLDMYGGVHVERVNVRFWLRRLATGSFWHARYSGTAQGFITSMVRAYGVFALLACVSFGCCILLARIGLSWWWVALPVLLLATCAIHEAGHAAAAKITGVRFLFLAKPGKAALLYARPTGPSERIISLAGPVLACIVCAVVWICADGDTVRFFACITGCIHMCSLLPWLADGKTIWRKS